MTDWPDLLEPVALELLGEPSRRTTSGEWRYGRKGSLAVHVAGHRAGTWRDYEAGVGGGVLDLLEHVEEIDRAEALVWLRRRDLLDDAQPPGDAARRFAGAEVAGTPGGSRQSLCGQPRAPFRPGISRTSRFGADLGSNPLAARRADPRRSRASRAALAGRTPPMAA